ESVSRIGGFKRVQNGLGGNPDNPSTSESVTATKNVFRTASESLSVGGLRFTDNFNRADGGMGANWVTDTSLNHPLAIVSNTCQGSTAATHNIATYNASGVLPANQYAQCKVAVIGGYVGTVLRSDTAGNFYVCYYPPSLGNSCTIYRFDAGIASFVASGSTSITPTVGDVIYFEAVGNALTFKINGVTVCTGTDGTYTGAGYAGIDIFDTGFAVDDFEVGAIGGAGTGDSVTRILQALRATTDAPVTAETISKTAGHPRTATDALATAESAIAIRAGQSLTRTTSESLITADSVVRISPKLRLTSDACTTLESVGRT